MFLDVADPKASYLAHKREIDVALARVLDGGRYIMGSEVSSFEREFAVFLSAEHVIGVANGTDALCLALRACGLKPGDRVITVSHTATATVAAIELAGASACLVDVDPQTFTMAPDDLERAIVEDAGGAPFKAVVPVHLYGQPADMPAIVEIAKRHGLAVIEDCAQCHGADIHGRRAGTWGDLAAFSFYPTKNLGALGDAGAVVANDSSLAERVRLMREYGWRQRFVSETAGTNSRLDELQAAVLRVKLKYLEAENARRRQLGDIYRAELPSEHIRMPAVRAGATHVYHQFCIRSRERDRLAEVLKENDIGSAVHYPIPIHMQPAYRERVAIAPGGLQRTEAIGQEILSLPVHPYLTEANLRRITRVISKHLLKAGSNG